MCKFSRRDIVASSLRSTASGAALTGFVLGLGLLAAASPALADSTESVLHVFAGGTGGENPYGGLTPDGKGNFFGTTIGGGSYNGGTVFELSPKRKRGWTYKVIYSFTGQSDGDKPKGPLVFDREGNLYGTCDGDTIVGNGAAFELSPDKAGQWHLSRSLLFDLNGPHGNDGFGAGPNGLIVDADGNLFGTAHDGGQGNLGLGYGTVFELIPTEGNTWKGQALHRFEGEVGDGLDGGFPDAGLIMDKHGDLYSVISIGGAHYAGYAYKMHKTKKGWVKIDIHDFDYNVDGQGPGTTLISDGEGNLYGTTNDYFGNVFRLDRPKKGAPRGQQWQETNLYQFPYAVSPHGLTLDPAGNLLGFAGPGGDNNCCGYAFQLTPTQSGPWIETTLYQFKGGSDVSDAYRAPVLDPAGVLYGTSIYGGNGGGNGEGDGTIFSVTR